MIPRLAFHTATLMGGSSFCASRMQAARSGRAVASLPLNQEAECMMGDVVKYNPQQQQSVGERPPKVFTGFNVYKGKAALQLVMIGPTWKATNKGDITLEREGVMYLEFANVGSNMQQQTQQSGYGRRSYNWEQKITFAMKSVELGNFLDEKLTSRGFDLFHDPNMGSPAAGSSRKTLNVKLNPDQSFMFSISHSEKAGGRQSVSVPISPAEMAVIRNLVGYAVPRLLGFDLLSETPNVLPSNARAAH